MSSSIHQSPRLPRGRWPFLTAVIGAVGALIVLGRPLLIDAQGPAPAQVGQWSAPITLPLVSLHLVVLPTGKVFMMGSQSQLAAGGAVVWNPATGVFIDAATPWANHFCSGHTFLADGRLLITGGDLGDGQGVPDADIYDPFTQSWSNAAGMSMSRWYPTNTLLGDGRVLTMGGTDQNLHTVSVQEIYDPLLNFWSQLPVSANMPYKYYPLNFLLPDGRLLVAGSYSDLEPTRTLNLTTNTWTTIDSTLRETGSAVMYQPGKIIDAGSRAYQYNTDSVPNARTLDMTTASPAWQPTGSMAHPRSYHTLTTLPDGQVLVTGGTTTGAKSTFALNVHAAEIWNPASGQWTTMASAVVEQGYHSSAALLPDGRVLVTGQGRALALWEPDPNDQKLAQIYSPPYLFKGARPSITSAPLSIVHGAAFSVGTPDAANIASVMMLTMPAVTHGFNENQHSLPLTFSVVPGGLSLQAPLDANLAPPGYYMLFIVNSTGVPSIASVIRILGDGTDNEAPTTPGGLAASPLPGSVALSWGASADNVGVIAYNVHRSLTNGFSADITNRVGQASGTSYTDKSLPGAGTYYYRVTAQDARGNISTPSNLAFATPLPAIVPNVVTQTQAAASAAIVNAGLIVGAVTTAPSAGPAGQVLSQNPTGGSPVAPGSAVALVISVSVPTLTTVVVTPAIALVSGGATQLYTAVGKDQYGALMSPQPAWNWTVSGGGTINPAGTFTAGGVPGGPFTVTASSGGVGSTASVGVIPAGELVIGQIAILSGTGSGDANYLQGIPATLVQDAMIQSLTANFHAVAGQCTLSIYADNGSNYPGALKAQTASFTPVVGWNTQNVITPLTLSPGKYWLVWQANNDSLGMAYASGTGITKSNPYGPPPATFPAGGGSNTDNSIYAMLFVGPASAIPTVATPAAATPSVVAGTTTALSVLGADDAGEAPLMYVWGTTGTPPAAVTFSANGTNAAKNTTATFTKAGTYTLQATIKDASNLAATSTVTVTVSQTLTSISVTPASASVGIGATQPFTASAKDQFGAVMTAQPAMTWTVSGGGTIDAAGMFAAGVTPSGPFTVTAENGAINGTAAVTVIIPNATPTVATPATATPSPVSATTTALSALGADDGGEAPLTYTWATTGTPPAAVTFSGNGTNAAKTTTATFTKAGSYSFLVTIKDAGNLTVTSPVTVTVNQTFTSIGVTPPSASVPIAGTQSFTASAMDQFGAVLVSQPSFSWSVGGGGTIAATGLFTAGAVVAGPFTVTASSGALNGTAQVTVTPLNLPPTVATPAAATPSPVPGTTTALSALGADDGGAAALTYTWATTGTPPAAVTFSANGTNAAKNTTATFTKAGSYTFQVTIKDAGNSTVTSSVTVTVNQTLTSITVTPPTATITAGTTQPYTASAKDQFGTALASQPTITWTVNGGGSINASGTFTGATAGGPFTVTATSGSINGTAAVTVLPAGLMFIGQTAVLSGTGSGDANYLQGIPAILGQTASIQSLSAHFKAVGGQSILSIFADNGSNYPGILKAQTVAFTPVVGWNTQNVTAPIALDPGKYWLIWQANNDDLGIAYSPNTGGGLTKTYPYGAPPVAFPSGAGANTDNSLYATLLAGPVNMAPTVATAAAATPSPVPGATTALTALGADDSGEAALTYTWATTGTPPAAVTFSANGTNAAKNATATFTKAGSYTFQVTIKDAGNLTVTSSVTVTVNQTVTTITVTPATASVGAGATQPFTASAKDQFGAVMAPQPTISWTIDTGGTISPAGLFTAGGTAGGPFTVTAANGAINGTALVTVTPVNQAPTVATTAAASPSPVPGTTTALSALGADDAGEAALTYTWATTGTPPAAVTFSANGTNAAKTTTATFTKAGSYTFQVTIKDVGNLTVTSSVTVTVNQTVTTITVTPATASVGAGATQPFTASAKDQFGAVLAPQPTIGWTVGGGGTISPAGLFTAGVTAGGPFTVTAANGAINGTALVTVTPVNFAPTVATAAAATPSPVPGTTTALSALGADDAGEAALTYTWATTGTPPAAVTFSANGTNAAKNATATFTKAGSYTFQVTIKDAGNLTVTSSVTVTVDQTLTTITVTPPSASVGTGATQSFAASAKDQFGAVLAPQPTIGWTVGGGGTISPAGLFTAGGTAGGPFTVTAANGAISGTALVTVTAVNAAPTVATAAAASPSPVPGTTTALSALGADDAGEAALTYTWATTGTPPAAVTFSANGTNATKNATATFTKAGSYTFQVTIKDAGNLTVTSSVTVTVNQTLTTITVTPASASVGTLGTQLYTASAKDQFGAALAPQPTFTWGVTGGGTIAASGLFTAGAVAGGPFTVTATSGALSGAASVTVTSAPPVSYVQGASFTSDAASNTITKAFTSANVAGNLIVVALSWGNNSTASCSDTLGNTYVVATTQWDNVNNQSLAICYAANVKAGANTVTATLSGLPEYRRMLIHEYRGLALVNPVDVVAKQIANGSTVANAITSTAAVTTASGDLIFGAVMEDVGTTTIAAGTGFTQRLSVNNKDLASEDQVQAVAGSIAATQTFGAAHRYLAQMVAFKKQ